MCPAILLLASLLDSGPRARVDLAVETSVHAGSEMPGTVPPDSLRGVDLQPSLTLGLADRTLAVESRYAPRLLAMPSDSSFTVRHDGSLRARWDQSRNLTWVSDARISYGQSTFVFDPGERRPFDSIDYVQPLIPDQLNAQGNVGMSFAAARGVTAIASVGYGAYGGTSPQSQELVPLQRGPQLYAALAQEVSRIDQLTTELYAAQTASSDGKQTFVVKGTEDWTRQLAAATRASASLGLSLEGGERSSGNGFYPVAGAQLRHDIEARASRIELRVSAQLGPHYSLVTSDLRQRAEIAASARWVLRSNLSLRGRAAAAHELGDPSRSGKIFIGAADLSWRLGTDTSLVWGFEAVQQRVAADVLAPTSTWYTFAALTAAARNLL